MTGGKQRVHTTKHGQLIVIFNLLWREFVEMNVTFRSASIDLDQDLWKQIKTSHSFQQTPSKVN